MASGLRGHLTFDPNATSTPRFTENAGDSRRNRSERRSGTSFDRREETGRSKFNRRTDGEDRRRRILERRRSSVETRLQSQVLHQQTP